MDFTFLDPKLGIFFNKKNYVNYMSDTGIAASAHRKALQSSFFWIFLVRMHLTPEPSGVY